MRTTLRGDSRSCVPESREKHSVISLRITHGFHSLQRAHSGYDDSREIYTSASLAETDYSFADGGLCSLRRLTVLPIWASPPTKSRH